MISNMAENNYKIISFKTAQEVFKNLNLGQKRQVDKGNNDYDIIEEILHHEGVELINFSDKNLDPDKLVSCIMLFLISMVLKMFSQHQILSDLHNQIRKLKCCFQPLPKIRFPKKSVTKELKYERQRNFSFIIIYFELKKFLNVLRSMFEAN